MLIHIHIPKNAGSTVDSILMRNFGERCYRFYTDRNGEFLSELELIEFIRKIKADTDFLCGHDIHPLAPQTSRQLGLNYLTFIRNPLERALSLYYHERRSTGKDHISQKQFDEYVRERPKEDGAISNWQTYNIAGEANFQKAKEVLDDFALVGLVERFDDSILLLNHKIKKGLLNVNLVNFNILYQKKNVSRNKTLTKPKIDEITLEKLIKMNQEDLQLFEYASNRLNEELKEVNNFQIKKNVFQTTNLIYNRYNQVTSKVRSLLNKLFSHI